MEADFAEPVQQSALIFYYQSLGLKYVLLLPLSGLLSFVMTLLLLLRGKGWAFVPALLITLSWPLMVGIFGVAEGIVSSIQVITASTTMPKPSELAQGYSMSLISAQVGMIFMLPSYLVAIVGTVLRSCLTNKTAS